MIILAASFLLLVAVLRSDCQAALVPSLPASSNEANKENTVDSVDVESAEELDNNKAEEQRR